MNGAVPVLGIDPPAAGERTADGFRRDLRAWLETERPRLEPFHSPGTGDPAVDHRRGLTLQRLLFDEGWGKAGWPRTVGGTGGTALLRAILYDEVVSQGYQVPDTWCMVEVIGEMLLRFAPDLAARHFGAVIRGTEVWCQGFSESDTGSDLASLRCRASRRGDIWVLNGHKVWTSFVDRASRCLVLARTGEPGSGHRGLTMFLVDLHSPGLTWRAIPAMNGRDEFGEVFFDDVHLPPERLVGGPGSGWPTAMYLLQWERGMYGWLRQAQLFRRLRDLLDDVGPDADPAALGAAYVALVAVRSQCREIVQRLAAGESPGPEISVAKLLLSTAEQQLMDTARDLLSPRLELDATDAGWRVDYLYSRVASIFGGTSEIQRQIVAERCLGLPRQGDR